MGAKKRSWLKQSGHFSLTSDINKGLSAKELLLSGYFLFFSKR